MTTGGFQSSELLAQESNIVLPEFSNAIAIEIGNLASQLGISRNLPIAIEVRSGEWTIFKAALPGSKPENDGWITRKSRVVHLTGHSTMYERVSAEEQGINWHETHGVVDETHAIHGGGIPLRTSDGVLHGALIISGLPQVDDHNFGIEILRTYLTH